MATLRHCHSQRTVTLLTEDLLGRSRLARVRLEDKQASGEHASIRWSGRAWVLRDLGSRNGTSVDGRSLAVGGEVRLAQGQRLCFGGAGCLWEVLDVAPPLACAVHRDGRMVLADAGVIVIPDESNPEVELRSGPEGSWLGDHGAVTHGDEVVASDGVWRLDLPGPVPPTLRAGPPARRLASARIELRHSLDEEHVELRVIAYDEAIELTPLNHNFLLLELARQRLRDRADAFAESEAGWVDRDDMMRRLRWSREQLNSEVYRARRQLKAARFEDAGTLIERRSRGTQLRIGVGKLEVIGPPT